MRNIYSSRWVPTLDSNTVADSIIRAVQRNHKFVIIPKFFRFMLIAKWIFPWECNSEFLRRLVVDAAPTHHASPELLKRASSQNLTNGSISANNNVKTSSSSVTSIHRTTSIGERVLQKVLMKLKFNNKKKKLCEINFCHLQHHIGFSFILTKRLSPKKI